MSPITALIYDACILPDLIFGEFIIDSDKALEKIKTAIAKNIQ